MAGYGFLAGICTVLVIAAFRRWHVVGLAGVAGFVLASSPSLLLPNLYLSYGILAIDSPEQVRKAEAVAHDRAFLQMLQARTDRLDMEVGSASFGIRYKDTDPVAARFVVSRIMTRSLYAADFDLLEPATKPASPSAPNRLLIAAIGAAVAMVLAIGLLPTARLSKPGY